VVVAVAVWLLLAEVMFGGVLASPAGPPGLSGLLGFNIEMGLVSLSVAVSRCRKMQLKISFVF